MTATAIDRPPRRVSRKIKVGNVEVGGDAPITVQSMTNTLTSDVHATSEQISRLAVAGADIVRVSCPDEASILKVVGHARRHQNERSGLGLKPSVAKQKAHGPGQHVEDVIFFVSMRAWPGRLRLKPPLRDRIAILGLGAVGFENGMYAAHGVAAATSWRQNDGRAVRCIDGHSDGLRTDGV